MPEQLIERKSVRKHGKGWHDRGPTWKNARRLYLKYPLVSVADIARILGVSRQAIHQYVEGLTEEREKRYEEALVKLKRKEGL
jgi:predicted ArsR family transcriptional regulator